MNKEKVTWYWTLLKESYWELKRNDPLRLSSSTAFFATFSIIPVLVLFLDAASTIFEVQMLKDEIFKSLQRIVGQNTTEHLANILANVQNIQQGPLLTIGIALFLLFVATTLFDVVHNSFNQILKVKLKERTALAFHLKNRGLFLLVLLSGGILFFLTFLTDVIVGYVGNNVFQLSHINPTIVRVLDVTFSAALFSVWLAILYKYLPDITLPWRSVWFGTGFTIILFLIGQFVLSKVMTSSNLDDIYGASASMVFLLLFIFYASFILFYGFCLIKKYAEETGYKFESTTFAVRYELKELD
ncbi:MAG: YihY/virulence factor BrkB family protein [Balneolaceae bacterium]|nr:YihY/virulence factor BrkB family protein [Balneolaceae bacterium]